MMKLRLGSTNADLTQRFAVFATTVTNIFTTWVKLLASELGCLIYNPSYEVFRNTLPKKFHKPGYSKVRHTIACTEVFIETPSDPALKATTWSDYKHHHTTKILLSITPNGAFNFVSKAWGGRTSDVHVTRESGFYDIWNSMMRSWLTGALLLLRIYFFNKQSSIYHPANVARNNLANQK